MDMFIDLFSQRNKALLIEPGDKMSPGSSWLGIEKTVNIKSRVERIKFLSLDLSFIFKNCTIPISVFFFL